MKVLFIENAGHKTAGAFRSLVSLAVMLRKHGVEAHVALPKTADGVSLLDENQIPFIQLQSCAYSRMMLAEPSFIEQIKMPVKDFVLKFSARKIAKYVKDNQIDIVHDNTSVSYIGMYAAKFAKVKHVWHIREFMEEDFNRKFWRRAAYLRLINKSDAVVAISQAVYDKYKGEIDNSKFSLIYNGIDIEKFLNTDRELFKSSPISVLCVGRISPGKGQELLIRATARLKTEYNQFITLNLAGSYQESQYNQMIDLARSYGIEEHVNLLGQCDDMNEVYRQNDVFCMASKCEAFGRVTIEAMLAGCIALGSNSGGTAEILTAGTGLTFHPNDEADLAKKLNYIIENQSLMKEKAKNGQEFAMQNFTSEKNAKEIYHLYCKLLDIERKKLINGEC
ncbi:glycosyltransferase family 4 protein [Streptococcus cristatus]|uniref:glycosyltransferase family 4 protein n=1 Tax=Streptococcus cristatus TaxID=45634 RepID=UPI0007852165|nr:glycosyltransferase family 4 protein [Streptococcus cristatus]